MEMTLRKVYLQLRLSRDKITVSCNVHCLVLSKNPIKAYCRELTALIKCLSINR